MNGFVPRFVVIMISFITFSSNKNFCIFGIQSRNIIRSLREDDVALHGTIMKVAMQAY